MLRYQIQQTGPAALTIRLTVAPGHASGRTATIVPSLPAPAISRRFAPPLRWWETVATATGIRLDRDAVPELVSDHRLDVVGQVGDQKRTGRQAPVQIPVETGVGARVPDQRLRRSAWRRPIAGQPPRTAR